MADSTKILKRLCRKCGKSQSFSSEMLGKKVKCSSCIALGHVSELMLARTSLRCPHCSNSLLSLYESGTNLVYCVRCRRENVVQLIEESEAELTTSSNCTLAASEVNQPVSVEGSDQTTVASPQDPQNTIDPPTADNLAERKKAEIDFLKHLSQTKTLGKTHRSGYCRKCGRKLGSRILECYVCSPKGV